MMSKRTGFRFRESANRAKMPKLDISITSSQSLSSQFRAPAALDPPTIRQNGHNDKDNIWGDDDDDEEFIMLASQAVEKVEAHAESVITQAMNFHGDLDMSYGRFRNEVEASTQLTFPPQRDAINDFLCSNDDEDIFSHIPDYPNVPDIQKPSTSKQPVNNARADKAKEEAQKRLEIAKEAQATLLTRKLQEHKKEIENLKEALSKTTEKCQIKEGEVCILGSSCLRPFFLKPKRFLCDNCSGLFTGIDTEV